MAIINEQVMQNIYTNRNHPRHGLFLEQLRHTNGYQPFVDLTPDGFKRVLKTLRDGLTHNGFFQGKILRPWEFDDNVYAKLDQDAVWWGWEFETGYTTHEERASVVGYTWDNFDNVTFDSEGEGLYPSEITFSPAEDYKFFGKEADAYKFVEYLTENRLGYNGGDNNIGTHINISSPGMRKNRDTISPLVRVLNRTLAATPKKYFEELFGRGRLYGGFYEQMGWIEGKVFRTTYNVEQFERYVAVAAALSRVIRAAETVHAETPMLPAPRNRKTGLHKELVCTNFYEIVKNPALPAILKSFENNPQARFGIHDDEVIIYDFDNLDTSGNPSLTQKPVQKYIDSLTVDVYEIK